MFRSITRSVSSNTTKVLKSNYSGLASTPATRANNVYSRKINTGVTRHFGTISYINPRVSEEEKNTPDLFTPKDIADAYERIKTTIARSPLEYSKVLSDLTGSQIYLKKEHSSSVTGSYKERGALNKLLQLSPEQMERGVVCVSRGNHSSALAFHSSRLGIDAVIVMPRNTPHVKIKKTASFGGRVVLHGESFAEAFVYAKELCEFENRTFVHAFNDTQICAGAGTVGIEIIEQNPFVDAIIVPVGGGGLISGISTFVKSVNPRIEIYGVEAAASPGMYKSLAAGHVVRVPNQSTMADGIAIEVVGEYTLPAIRKYVDDIVVVDEDALAASVLHFLELEKTVVEASGAAGLTALLEGKLPHLKGKKVALVVTGSNIDMTLLGRILQKGLVKSGRLARIAVVIKDIPGQLERICRCASELGVNIKEIRHERAFLLETIGITQPILDVETKDFDHIEKFVEALKEAGFSDTHVITPFR